MLTSCSPITFQGLEDAMVKGSSHKGPLYSMFQASGEEDVAADEYSVHHVEKKRRLTVDQVKLLEKTFEMENKLEPERKVHLARDLGLQPRQVAVWFQNRRARWKTKQLEKEYEILKADYDELKREYDEAVKEKEKIQAQVLCLGEKLRSTINSETRGSFENSSMHLFNQLSKEITTQLDLNSVNRLLVKAGKEGSTSSDSADSEVLDVECPLISLENPICSDTPPNLVCIDPPSMINIGNENLYEKVLPHLIQSQRSSHVKLEDESYPEENSNYNFLTLEDQVTGFPWWDWS